MTEINEVPAAWSEEPDGSAIGYMCLTDWEYEIGSASGGNGVYPSVEDLRRCRPCVDECGIIKVRVLGIEVVQPENHDGEAA